MSFSGQHVITKISSDQAALARMGKKQILKRKFGFVSIFSFSCTVLNTWEGVVSLLGTGFYNGGTVGLIGQYILIWFGTLSTFIVIGELASMAPTSGGQYHWVAMLSPRRYRNFFSYLTGWMTCLAWVGTVAFGCYQAAAMTTSICRVGSTKYGEDYRPYQLTLISWGVVLFAAFTNTVVGTFLPQVEGSFLIVHVLGFFGVLIPLVYYAPRQSIEETFGQPYGRYNGGGWAHYGVSFMVGTVGAAFAFVGADAAVHMSEEISSPAINVPRSIFGSVMLNGVLGFGMTIAVVFCMGDPEAAMRAESETGYPFMEIFYAATNSRFGAAVMSSVVIVMQFGATVGFLATGSRMVWSFARDNGLPFSKQLSKVSPVAKIPVTATLVASIIPCLLLLIVIGSEDVFSDVTSLSLVGFYSTYFASCSLLLYHRIFGSIRYTGRHEPAVPAYQDEKTGDFVLTWGRWHFKGILGTINNIFACAYLITIGWFAFFPETTPTSAAAMNYACVEFGGVIIYSLFYYAIWGRKQYNGPIVEIIL